MLERYGHGGDLRTATETYGITSTSFVDFSSNMNPLGPPSVVQNVLIQYAKDIHNYPDPAVRELRDKLSEIHHIEVNSLLIGNGAAELIDLVVRALKPNKVAIAVPCFAEYGDAARKQGIEVVELPLHSKSGFVLDEEWVRQSLENGKADLYMLGSPNNPTGRFVSSKLIVQLLDSGATVVVDEAFMDFVQEEDDHSLIRKASSHERLFVIRSMTKFYSIPGIRLGYIVGHPERIELLRALQVPWSVNSLAQLIGVAVLGDLTFVNDTKNWLQIEKEYLTAGLLQLGFDVFPSEVNYLLLRLPTVMNKSSSQLQDELGHRGVLIRDASRFPGLDHSYIRVAIKLREHNERLLHEISDLLSVGGSDVGR
ncbi:threonine-phosphate decarboxylase [Paenibacillus sp. GSMTC-2017]|uniref:threonine-phosphate decarboxylase CobD n=1 Tax=Paenibacillus sp. GSMTC-2017 TaxID=2794350 RepID=UPI0018D854F0|nr:threonine-phosphate decarboxylase CobD [Paenibacillus sp. GSMTC-2017]MBH5316494.1 threonine-phosphate decarboxylase [Paenibacillus sp. GSMTC-2017]